MVPEGTRYFLPPEARLRREMEERLFRLLFAWGYEPVELPALEFYDPSHPLAERAFKLVDKTGEVLALRSEFTTAVAGLLRSNGGPPSNRPVRLQYAGTLWLREATAELGRSREFRQVGAELVGVSSPQADAEVLELAWECLKEVGFPEARIEVGLPALVRDLLEATGLPEDRKERLRQAIHRKNSPELSALLEAYGVYPELARTLLALPDLYGGREVLEEARRLPLSSKARADLDWLEAVLNLLPEVPLLLDLGRARLLGFYTGLNFQAYTPDFGLPLLGGGRYDGALLPYAVGFALGLERVMEALRLPTSETPPQALALDRDLARRLREEGLRVELAWTSDLEELRAYARQRGIRWLALEGRLEELAPA
ncbi:MAG: ATP phosphoribosyltransferase regulatory subunit [Meiothermus sp.]|uniref:ATP phosphoribosyltransferase regulatory subunit n=1 Tax=Meiothermus sp. TaxID=1955249 RepID=UPI0025DA627D|nr:ATP phosphoribosyltransferase regulatory subunit [Meiothermus sp.]MCS7194762.1 ATP phosphoribosyltransferase regulatory subunit [Meiothermus sp.]MDW8091247.1 ATP phosphoribosyltransferase regulatory subunit [Meiothermus sp.]MDW8480366.1 ATP phosphoribosyltransferase regulatory subunit [Meiothermus sp.]